MPNLYFQGIISLISKGNFMNRDGAQIVWYKNYIQAKDSNSGMQVIEINSSKDFSDKIGKTCTFEVSLYPITGSSGYKISLKSCEVVDIKT